MSQISGNDLSKLFYDGGTCILEKEIERIYDASVISICPNTIVHKTKLRNGQTDDIFRFYDDENNLKFWILQECKRDIGFKSVQTPRAFLQLLYYLTNFYYDVSPLGLDKFKGIFLDSARYFSYIPKEALDPIMEEFEPLYNKYSRVRPSEAHVIPELMDWVNVVFKDVKKYVFLLDTNFRFDVFIRDLYENKI